MDPGSEGYGETTASNPVAVESVTASLTQLRTDIDVTDTQTNRPRTIASITIRDIIADSTSDDPDGIQKDLLITKQA